MAGQTAKWMVRFLDSACGQMLRKRRYVDEWNESVMTIELPNEGQFRQMMDKVDEGIGRGQGRGVQMERGPVFDKDGVCAGGLECTNTRYDANTTANPSFLGRKDAAGRVTVDVHFPAVAPAKHDTRSNAALQRLLREAAENVGGLVD
jgi:coproporphyrinogen III oxidase